MSKQHKRIVLELKELIEDPPFNCSAGPINDEDMTKWEGSIIGPEGTPYEGGLFKISIRFPEDYPFVPPKVKFITRSNPIFLDSENIWNLLSISLIAEFKIPTAFSEVVITYSSKLGAVTK